MLKPGTIGDCDPTIGWTLENEINWTNFYISGLMIKPFLNLHQLTYQRTRLADLLEQRARWIRFIDYCNGRS